MSPRGNRCAFNQVKLYGEGAAHTKKKEKEMKNRTWMLLLGLLIGIIGTAGADLYIYDDFSSNDLSKWTGYTSAESIITVADEQLKWVGKAGTGWGWEYINSTDDTFDLSASAAAPLQVAVDIAKLTPRTDGASAYEAFELGWQDASGDTLMLRYSFRGQQAGSLSSVGIFFNNSLLAGAANSPGYYFTTGDTAILSWDGTNVSIKRIRAGTELTILTRSFSNPAFTGNGSIRAGMNFEGAVGSELILDNFSSIPEPATAGSLVISSAGLLSARRIMRL